MTTNSILREYADRRIRLLDQIDDIKADLKELDLEAKTKHDINTRELHRWANAERKDQIGKLVAQVYASVQYGEALGHGVMGAASTLQHEGRRDENNSNPPHDAVTGEIIEQNAQRPSNRDVSAGDEPSPEAGPQAEASLAGTGAGTPAGHEGHTPERGGQAVEAVAEDGQPDPDTLPPFSPSLTDEELAVIGDRISAARKSLPPSLKPAEMLARPAARNPTTSTSMRTCGGPYERRGTRRLPYLDRTHGR